MTHSRTRRDFIRMVALGSGSVLLPRAFGQPTAAKGAAALDADLKKVYDEAVKVIPGLSPDILAGAKREGSLSLYRLTYGYDPVFAEFNKLFPFVRITDFRAGGGALYQRYTAEARAERYIADVVQSAEPSQADEADSQGLVTHYEISSAKAIPEQYVRKGVYYPFGLSLLNLAYNSDLVSEADAAVLQTWDGMLDPRWKGKVGILRYGLGGAISLPLYWVWKEKGKGFWDKLFAQQPLTLGGMAVAAERVSAGGYSVHLFANDTSFFDFQKKGAPLRWKYPEPTLAFPNIQYIAKNPPHPNAAKLWLEWMASLPAQRVLMKEIGTLTPRTDLKDERPFVKEPWYKAPPRFYKYDWSDVGKERSVIQQLWDGTSANRKDSK